MKSFIPTISPSKYRMMSPSKVDGAILEDGIIEIPDSAGLSDETREAIYNVWASEDLDEDHGFVDGMHYTRVTFPPPSPPSPSVSLLRQDCQATKYRQRNAKLNLTIRYLVKQLQDKVSHHSPQSHH